MILVVVYYIVFFFLFRFYRRSDWDNTKKSQVLIAFLLLFLFFGLRDLTVLNDTPHYYSPLRDKMTYARNLGWFEVNAFARFEPGYQIFENFHAKLFSNPYSIIMSSALIVSISNILLFRHLNGSYLFLCLFLMLNFQMENQYSAIRQGIATAILYYGIVKLMDGSWIKFVFSVIFATTFHVTAIISIVLLLFKYVRFTITRKKMVLIIIFFFFFVEFLLSYFVGWFSTDDVYMNINENRESFPLGSLIFALLNTYLLYSSYILSKHVNNKADYMFWILGIFCVFISFADISFPIVGRTAMYFFPFLVSLYAKSLQDTQPKYRNKNLQLTFILFFGWFVAYNFLKPEWYHLYPYSFMDITNIFTGYEVR